MSSADKKVGETHGPPFRFTLFFPMPIKEFALMAAVMVLATVSPPVLAHHGPPHEEIDEFESPVSRLVVPEVGGRFSLPALLVTLAGLAVAVVAARKWGVDAVPVPVPDLARVRR